MADVVVVVVVCVMLTVPIGSAGDPAQRIDTVASSKATGSSLRTDITLGSSLLERQIDARHGSDPSMQAGVMQRDQRAQREQHLAFEVRFQAGREIDAPGP